MKYGDILKKLRNEKGLSQQELTDRLNINRSTYARYETSNTQPDYDTLKLLADYFEVSTDYILGRTENPNKEKNNEFDPMSEINRLIKDYGIEHSGFHDIDRWKAMGPEEILELEKYFKYITDMAKKKNEEDS